MPDQEQILPMIFPVYGINLITEFELQLPNTTPIALNVRGYEPLTMRDRGGSRQGLSKWIDAYVNGTGPCQIQDLNQLVTCSGAALLTSFGLDLVGVPTIPDPDNPAYLVPLYGSGVQLSPNYGSSQAAPSGGTGVAGVTTAGGSGGRFAANLEGGGTVTMNVLSGTGTLQTGVGFIGTLIGGTYYFQPPTYAS